MGTHLRFDVDATGRRRSGLKITCAAAGIAVALSLASPASAQVNGEGSMAVGNATVTVGGGTAILTLPDVPSFVTLQDQAVPRGAIDDFKFSDDFGDEVGWNVNASIAAPMTGTNGRPKEISLNGFWANIDDEDSDICTAGPGENCAWYPLVDDPAVSQTTATNPPDSVISVAERDVDLWGVSLESKWTLNPGVMGVTRAPHRRYVAFGADVRGIDQDLDVAITSTDQGGGARGPVAYEEDLDTRYYGAYAALGGDYTPFLLNGLWERWGLQSSFRLQGGVYHADTDYDGRITRDDSTFGGNIISALSLSEENIAFIGGGALETRKRIGPRATLSLKSEFEYYSWVPEMAYNTVDQPAIPPPNGRQDGTVINDDDAFSARTSLRLTVKLGPRDVVENSYK